MLSSLLYICVIFFFQAEDGIRDHCVTGVQTLLFRSTLYATAHFDPQPIDRPAPIGRPLPGSRMYLLDERLRPVPPGVAGEVFLRSEERRVGKGGRSRWSPDG